MTAVAPDPKELAGYSAPTADHDSLVFWEGCKEGRFILQQCSDCERFRWPHVTVCPDCLSRDWAHVDAAGTGALYSWTWIHHATVPTPAELLPYCVALVALDEDPQILVPGQFEGQRDELEHGMRVEAVYRTAPDGTTVVRWQPAS